MAKKIKPDAEFIRREITKLFPDARCELNYSSELELLFAILLSAQTTDVSVNKSTPALFAKYKTIDDFANANLEDLEKTIRFIGLYKNKAKFLKQTATMLRDRFQGNIPVDQKALETLPGVGRKTANVFLAEWHHIPKIAVDTHVARVSIRLGFALEKSSPETIEKRLMAAYDKEVWIDLHHKFVIFGRYFCKAKKPKCGECPLLHVCKKPLQ
jgi:endonuclease-3